MRINILGANGRVTGSCTWMKYENTGTEFLVDCGMIQGEAHSEFENAQAFEFDPHRIKFVLLTHAHLDHCGLIPKLYREGFVGKIICTKATADLSRNIMYDAATLDAPYEINDVRKVKFECIDNRRKFKWGKPEPIDDNILVYFMRSSHILGSASIGVIWFDANKSESKQIFFSGDIGCNKDGNCYQPLIKERQTPYLKTDYIVLESTYGGREREKKYCIFENRIEALEKAILDTIYKKRGQLLIPTFSLHRTQEILLDLYYILSIRWNNEIPSKCNPTIYELEAGVPYWKYNQWMGKLSDKDMTFIENVIEYKLEKKINQNAYSFLKNRLTKSKDKELLCECYGKFQKDNEYYQLNLSVSVNKKKMFIEVLKNLVDSSILTCYLKEIGFHKVEDAKRVLSKIELETPVRIIMDSPLGQNISMVYGNNLFSKDFRGKFLYLNKDLDNLFGNFSEQSIEETIKMIFNDQKISIGPHTIKKKEPKNTKDIPYPAIILTSSGMCSDGPVVHHLERILPHKKNTILINGYQAKSTNGYVLLNLDKYKSDDMKFPVSNNFEIPVNDINAEISNIAGFYSGHADKNSLLDYVYISYNGESSSIPIVFLNHGDDTSRNELKAAILERFENLDRKACSNLIQKPEIIIPEAFKSRWFDLNIGKYVDEKTVDPNSSLNILSAKIEKLTEAITKLSDKLDRLQV